jgi:hypothetical protein
MTAAAVHRWQRECERSGGDCASRVEAVALRQPWARALRHGSRLTLFTVEGEVHFVDGAGGDATYRYLGLLAPGSTHLVARRTKSRQGFLTVSDLDARQTLHDQLVQALRPRAPALGELSFVR